MHQLITWTFGMTSDNPRPLIAQKAMAAFKLGDRLKPNVIKPHMMHPQVITHTLLNQCPARHA